MSYPISFLFVVIAILDISRCQPSFDDCNAMPVCEGSPPPNAWLSNLTAAPQGAGSTGGYLISWDPDPSDPNATYAVLGTPTGAFLPIAPMNQAPDGTNQVLISNLDEGTEYVFLVCYTDVTAIEFPSENNPFTPSCGYCFTCFTTAEAPTSAGTIPVIVQIIRTDFGGQFGIRATFTCTATGSPRPEITWRATNINSGSVGPVMDGDPGIQISSQAINQSFISSEITLFQNSVFRMPRCMATNENGVDIMMPGEVVNVPFSPTTTATTANPNAPVIIESTRMNIPGARIFTCKATGTPIPQITWRVQQDSDGAVVPVANGGFGVEITTNTDQSCIVGQLTLPDSSPVGMPRCVATNTVDEVVVMPGGFTLINPPPPPPPPDTSLPPSAPVIITATRTDLPQQNIRVFTCKATGTPIPDITWEAERDDNRLRVPVVDGDFDVTITSERNETCVVGQFTLPDNSPVMRPRCTATNDVDEDTVTSGEFEIIRPSQPSVPFTAEGTVTFGGIDGTVYDCEASGNPIPTIMWEAFDPEDDEVIPLEDELDGIQIEAFPEPGEFEIESTLTLADDSRFQMIMCVATSGEMELVVGGDEIAFEEVQGPTDNGSRIFFPTYATILIAAGVSAMIILTVIIILGVCLRRHLKKYKKMYAAETASNSTNNDDTASAEAETSFVRQQTKRKLSLLTKLPEDMILSSDVLQVSTIIGQGEFGVVYKGYLKTDMVETVAIKTLKGIFITAQDIENVKAEILKMSKFDHPNVMKLMGVCVAPSGQDGGAGGPCIVMPFMAKGSLLDFVRKESDRLVIKSEDDPNFLDVRTNLLQMSLQVAKGMEYLASLRFVHRDLAARNCLMDANNIIKISDFGLAEDIYSQNYFRQVQGGIKLPLKWMALESIKLAIFSEKTDVWSYGVTCWEIFNGGAIPYPGIHPRNILSHLEDGGRLEKPKNLACCDNMYKLMRCFWNEKPEDRPDFSNIVNTLTSYLIITSDYLDLGAVNGTSAAVVNGCPDCRAMAIPAKADQLEADPARSLPRVPSEPNDYMVAGPNTLTE